MHISFEDRKFQALCNNQRKLKKKHGDKRAKKITLRLATLAAAETLQDMRHAPGRCHELTGDRVGQFALDLDHPYRLIFIPDHDPIPTKEDDDGIDWSAITAITILEVTDYHD